MEVIRISFFLVISAYLIANTYADNPIIYNCVDMPFYMEKDKQNNYSGTLVNIFKQSADNAGLKNYTINMVPPNRMIQNMAEGKAHVWNGIVLPQLKETSLIGTVKLSTITLAIYSMDSNLENYQFPEALANKSLIIIKGFSYGGYLNELKKSNLKITFYETRNHESAIKMLQMKRSKFLLNYVEPMNLILNKNKSTKLHYSKLKSLDTFFVVSKKHPDAKTILQKLESGFQKINQKIGP